MKHMPSASGQLGAGGWHKPWSGHNGGSCVEVKPLPGGQFALRQSADPAGPALIFTEAELDVFAAGWTPHKADLPTA